MLNCVFRNNSASGNGGAVYNKNNLTDLFDDTLFYSNTAGTSGGAHYSFGSPPNIQNSTLANNSAVVSGGCLYDRNGGAIADVIMWGNTAPSGPQIFDSGTATVVTYSDIQGGWTGTGNLNANPLFVAGPRGTYYLSQIAAGQGSTSPCVDTGSNTAVFHALDKVTTRTDGVPDSGTVDIGWHYLP